MIGSIGSTAPSLSVASVLQAGITSAVSGTGALTGAGDTADISGPGKLFAALKELAAEDPEKFKAVAADIATKLKEAAEKASDATGSVAGPSSLLSDLAAKFETAAETGDVSVLEPPSQGPGGVGGYNRAGRPNGPPPPPPADSGVDLKALFDSITKEVTDALAA